MARLTDRIIQAQEDRNIPPKKHHEMPFLRGCIAVFPLSYSVTNATGYITLQVVSVKCLWENKIAKEGQPLLQ